MKQIHRNTALTALTALLSLSLITPTFADSGSKSAAAEVDFGKWMPPAHGGEFVEVNLKENILGMAARLATKDQPEIAELLGGIHSIRVNVIGLDDGNRGDTTDRIKVLRGKLDSAGWERVVTANENHSDVAVHLMTHGKEAVEGLVVSVLEDGKQAVVVNIVGDIRPEKLAVIGEKFGIEPLKQLGVPGGKQGAKTETKP